MRHSLTPYLVQILTFIKIVEKQRFSDAALALAISPTAVTKQIKILEQHVKHPLFKRHTRRIALTEFGRQFYELCLAFDNKVSNLEEFIASQQSEPQGKLHIVSALYVAHQNIINQLSELSQKYQKIGFHNGFFRFPKRQPQ